MAPKRHAFTSPLRYPGGKGMLSNFVKLVIERNSLLDGHYVEVYAGGASIAWSLLFDEYVRYVHINDIDRAVYSFWHSVLFRTEDLCRMICDIPVNMCSWRNQRRILREASDHSRLELGFAAFFMNRTNRSGIINGGVIGGKGQDGKWKLDARFNKKDLVERILRIARYASRIKIYNLDAAVMLQDLAQTLPSRCLFYLDPPYYLKGNDLYEHHYSHPDHLMISRILADFPSRAWIVTYDSAPQVVRLYRGYRRIFYKVSYSARERYSGAEVMFLSNSIVAPEASDPVRVTSVVENSRLSRN
jgi:DNA adenine methylase